jgi:uncharacterized protein with GYD domain
MIPYMIQWSYRSEQVKALVEHPHDRAAEFKKLVEAFEGRLVCYYFAFGEFDGIAIAEFPDDVSGAACVLEAAATGAGRIKTSVLLSTDSAVEAMRQARAVEHGYRTPTGYASIG